MVSISLMENNRFNVQPWTKTKHFGLVSVHLLKAGRPGLDTVLSVLPKFEVSR